MNDMDLEDRSIQTAGTLVELLQGKLEEAGFYALATRLRGIDVIDPHSLFLVHIILLQSDRPDDPELGAWWDLALSNTTRVAHQLLETRLAA